MNRDKQSSETALCGIRGYRALCANMEGGFQIYQWASIYMCLKIFIDSRREGLCTWSLQEGWRKWKLHFSLGEENCEDPMKINPSQWKEDGRHHGCELNSTMSLPRTLCRPFLPQMFISMCEVASVVLELSHGKTNQTKPNQNPPP